MNRLTAECCERAFGCAAGSIQNQQGAIRLQGRDGYLTACSTYAWLTYERLAAYCVELPLKEGSFKWSGGKSVTVFDSTIIEIEADAGSYVTLSTADGAPQRQQGRLAASTAPGLGIRPRMDVLGPRVVDISERQSAK